MKKHILWAVGILVLLGAWVLWGTESQEPETIKVGVIASLTGGGAARGESALQGIELAKKEIADKGILHNKTIEFVVQDVPLEKPKDAVAAFNYLVDVEKVVAIVGPMGSGAAMSLAPLVDAKKVPIIVHAASVQGATEGNEYLLRLWPTADQYADAMMQTLTASGYTKVAFLSATHENTIELSAILKERLGNKVSIEESVSVDTKDFRTQLTKIKQAEPDAVFINVFAGQIGVAAHQALGIDATLFTNGVMSVAELEKAEGGLEDAWFPRFSGYTQEARKEFVAFLGKEPAVPENAAAGHDAAIAIAEAIAHHGSNSEGIKNYLYSHKFKGTIGDFSFLETGNAQLPIAIWTVHADDLVEVE